MHKKHLKKFNTLQDKKYTKKLRIEGKFLNLKRAFTKYSLNFILNSKRLKAFFLISGKDKEVHSRQFFKHGTGGSI